MKSLSAQLFWRLFMKFQPALPEEIIRSTKFSCFDVELLLKKKSDSMTQTDSNAPSKSSAIFLHGYLVELDSAVSKTEADHLVYICDYLITVCCTRMESEDPYHYLLALNLSLRRILDCNSTEQIERILPKVSTMKQVILKHNYH